ncbi:hypothetical protein AKUH4B412M_04730 [Apilactobacillus kunkeei]|uniref:DUF2513 domain-containing protein n=1 Tax=Apilactobacillus kunkeei TaxID=148814 RepID=UPI00200B32EF|nr:DUF2513 domain-containing protein [Apilactobacillus kunkeei]MCK8628762.1 DUF2513 domain-containing protein [Apilactobacillus kunkeei]MCK8633924.1 DUF2513 domain-containing protein [Apilactobacillus kunkeei]CAI2579092.1 hypothetical protein AKUG0802_04690 [Apilactobacillus kunkeei]CAI2579179.1 hypothetical protein AKUG0804_04710 [Apilactobacillus kunkeei]CAI2579678.1 hypothetical protein AKUG0101_04750 [Apilactobacillus kunkeei]
MKLNHDCTRECLLFLEQELELNKSIDPADVINSLNYTEDITSYSLQKLREANYIVGGVNISYDFYGNGTVENTPIKDITWEGHEYLNTVRDNRVWKKTKDITSSLKSVSLSMMKTVATQVLVGILKDVSGLPL